MLSPLSRSASPIGSPIGSTAPLAGCGIARHGISISSTSVWPGKRGMSRSRAASPSPERDEAQRPEFDRRVAPAAAERQIGRCPKKPAQPLPIHRGLSTACGGSPPDRRDPRAPRRARPARPAALRARPPTDRRGSARAGSASHSAPGETASGRYCRPQHRVGQPSVERVGPAVVDAEQMVGAAAPPLRRRGIRHAGRRCAGHGSWSALSRTRTTEREPISARRKSPSAASRLAWSTASHGRVKICAISAANTS